MLRLQERTTKGRKFEMKSENLPLHWATLLVFSQCTWMRKGETGLWAFLIAVTTSMLFAVNSIKVSCEVGSCHLYDVTHQWVKNEFPSKSQQSQSGWWEQRMALTDIICQHDIICGRVKIHSSSNFNMENEKHTQSLWSTFFSHSIGIRWTLYIHEEWPHLHTEIIFTTRDLPLTRKSNYNTF